MKTETQRIKLVLPVSLRSLSLSLFCFLLPLVYFILYSLSACFTCFTCATNLFVFLSAFFFSVAHLSNPNRAFFLLKRTGRSTYIKNMIPYFTPTYNVYTLTLAPRTAYFCGLHTQTHTHTSIKYIWNNNNMIWQEQKSQSIVLFLVPKKEEKKLGTNFSHRFTTQSIFTFIVRVFVIACTSICVCVCTRGNSGKVY